MQEDWGELNTGKKPPALFVLDLKRCDVKPVKGLPADTSIGQPEWTPDGMSCAILYMLTLNMRGLVFCLTVMQVLPVIVMLLSLSLNSMP